MEIRGTTAFVTGGASGLGAGTVRALHAKGASVVIVDMNADAGEALAKELGDGAVFARADVANPDDVSGALGSADSMPPLRIVVNCAGIAWATRTLNKEGMPHDMDSFRKVIEVNLIGTFNVMRLSAAVMAKTDPLEYGERGVIVNTASVAALEGQIGQIAYSASKGGVAAMALPAARDLAPVGIRVNTIAPGLIDTPMLSLLPESAREALAQSVNFPKRLGTPTDYASLVVQLAENGYINGELIRLDGGLRMQPK